MDVPYVVTEAEDNALKPLDEERSQELHEVKQLENMLGNAVRTVDGIYVFMELLARIMAYRPDLRDASTTTKEIWSRIEDNNIKSIDYGNKLFSLIRKAMIKLSVVFDQANEAGIKIGELNPEKCGYIAIQQLKEERDRVLNAIDEVEKVAREFEQLKENPFGDVREDGKHFLADFFDHAGPGAKAVQTDYDAIAEYMAKLAKVDALLGSHYDEYFEQAAELTAFEAKSKYEELQIASNEEQHQILQESIKALQLRKKLVKERGEKEQQELRERERQQKEKLERMKIDALAKNEERRQQINAAKQAAFDQQQKILLEMQTELQRIS